MPTHHGAETLYKVSQSSAGQSSTTPYPTTGPGSLPAAVQSAVTAMNGTGNTSFTQCYHTTLSGGGATTFDYVTAVSVPSETGSASTYMVVETTDPSQSVLWFTVPGP